ncbi:MAG: YggS family pyridoxal phosphate-dependent enzyme [Clostridia bacterium]|nr:YggS family pyridoxal phosphate-dependent enzyme [Clostridia bacterium]
MTEKSSAEIFDENYKEILKKIEESAAASGRKKEDITLLAATKTVDVDTINHAIESGIEYIGENRVQEFLSKKDGLSNCHRHFIGHLQTNKVKDIVPFVELIHSVDSFRLANEISKVSLKLRKTTDILLEVNIGNEDSKSGFKEWELCENFQKISKLEGIRIRGLMAIPPICSKNEKNTEYFRKMKKLFIDICTENIDNNNINILSMGMSDDYDEAIKCGANLVRIGTALFGKREYNNK